MLQRHYSTDQVIVYPERSEGQNHFNTDLQMIKVIQDNEWNQMVAEALQYRAQEI